MGKICQSIQSERPYNSATQADTQTRTHRHEAAPCLPLHSPRADTSQRVTQGCPDVPRSSGTEPETV